jgi:hypothetical protein
MAQPPSDRTRSRTRSRRAKGRHSLERRGTATVAPAGTSREPVVCIDDACAYRCAYRFVSTGGISLQFAAPCTCAICSIFQPGAPSFRSFSWTLNPKVAGSSPARPMRISLLTPAAPQSTRPATCSASSSPAGAKTSTSPYRSNEHASPSALAESIGCRWGADGDGVAAGGGPRLVAWATRFVSGGSVLRND